MPPPLPPPACSYVVSAQALVGGKLIPASNTMPLQMPAPNAPTLVDAEDRGSTKAYALAAPPAGGSCDAYIFTFAPVNSAGAPVVREVASKDIVVNVLAPATTYDVSVRCKKGGALSGPSNTQQVGRVGRGEGAQGQGARAGAEACGALSRLPGNNHAP